MGPFWGLSWFRVSFGVYSEFGLPPSGIEGGPTGLGAQQSCRLLVVECVLHRCDHHNQHRHHINFHQHYDAKVRHVGDLGNIKAVNGVARVDVVDDMAKLT